MSTNILLGHPSGKALLPATALLGRAGLLSERARPVRFVLTGGTAGVIQLSALLLLTSQGVTPVLANIVAFLLAAQVNFTLSQLFTWHDRGMVLPGFGLAQRWLTFHCCIAGTALLNMAVFAIVLSFVPHLAAAALGIGAAAVLNFLANDRLSFRVGSPVKSKASPVVTAAP